MGVVVYEKKEKASWVVGDHKPQKHTRQGQAAITHPFSFIHTPFFPSLFPPFSFYSFSPLHNGLYLFKTKKHSQLLFPFLSLKNTLTKKKNKMKEQ